MCALRCQSPSRCTSSRALARPNAWPAASYRSKSSGASLIAAPAPHSSPEDPLRPLQGRVEAPGGPCGPGTYDVTSVHLLASLVQCGTPPTLTRGSVIDRT